MTHDTGLKERRLGGLLAWSIWTLGTLFVIFKFISQTVYSIINPQIARDLYLSMAEIGFLGSVYTFATALALPFGVLFDLLGARLILALAMALISLGGVIFCMSDTWYSIILGQFLMGVGGAFGFPGAGYLTKHWFKPIHFGVIFGLVQSLCCIVAGFAQSGIGYLSQAWDWRAIMMAGSGIGIFLTVAIYIIVKDPKEIVQGSTEKRSAFWGDFYDSIREVVTNRQIWIVSVPGATTFGVVISIGVLWGIKVLLVRGFDPVTASNINSFLWIGLAAGAPLIAMFANKINSHKTPLTIFTFGLCVTVFYLLFSGILQLWQAYLTFFLIGFFSAAQMVSFTMATELCRGKVAGTAISFVNMIMFIVSGALISLPAKTLRIDNLDLQQLQNALMAMPITLVISCFFIIFLKETKGILPKEEVVAAAAGEKAFGVSSAAGVSEPSSDSH
ncbi:MAG: MFS transporter [Oligoflexales bacterium]|nr:MFS transporter [Oligoflexales bacterium]